LLEDTPLFAVSYLLYPRLSYQFFVDDNHRVFFYEDGTWTIKGRYEHALETDEDVCWTEENGEDVLRFSFVSFSWYDFTKSVQT
jgi:hypothetical protein